MPLIEKIGNAQNLSYMFYKTSVDNVDILDLITLARNNIIFDYCFGECPNITNIDGLVLPAKVISAVGMFYKNNNLLTANGVDIKVKGSISKFLAECGKLNSINGMTIANVTDTSYTFYNDVKITTMLDNIPSTCNCADYMYANTSVESCDFTGKQFGSISCTYSNFMAGAYDITAYLNFTSGNILALGGVVDNCSDIVLDLTGMDLSSIYDFTDWFKDKTGLKQIILDEVTWNSTEKLIYNNAFSGCTSLIEDFIMPTNMFECQNCFEDCYNMIYAHSNWETTYEKTIVPTNCYKGCIGIDYIDDEKVSNGYTCGIDLIPLKWGGNEFTENVTSIIEIEVPEDNYTFSFPACILFLSRSTISDNKVRWGDNGRNVETMSLGQNDAVTHTYAKAGKYIVKGNIMPGSYGQGTNDQIKYIKRILQMVQDFSAVNKYTHWGTPASYLRFYKWLGLTEINLGNMKNFTKLSLQQCTNLKFISGTPDFSACTDLSNCFDGVNAPIQEDGEWDFIKNWNILPSCNKTYMFASNSSIIDPPITDLYGECGYIYLSCPNLNATNTLFKIGYNPNLRNALQNNSVTTQLHFEWVDDTPVSSMESFMLGSVNKVTSIETFNLTSTGAEALKINFFGGTFGTKRNTALTTVKFSGVLSESHEYLYLYPNLSKETLLNLFDCLCVNSDTSTTLTLTLHTNHATILSDTDMAIATNKGWTLAFSSAS